MFQTHGVRPATPSPYTMYIHKPAFLLRRSPKIWQCLGLSVRLYFIELFSSGLFVVDHFQVLLHSTWNQEDPQKGLVVGLNFAYDCCV